MCLHQGSHTPHHGSQGNTFIHTCAISRSVPTGKIHAFINMFGANLPLPKIFSVGLAQMDDCAENFSARSAEMEGYAENFAAHWAQMGTTDSMTFFKGQILVLKLLTKTHKQNLTKPNVICRWECLLFNR